MKFLLLVILIVVATACDKQSPLKRLERQIIETPPEAVELSSVTATFKTRKARRVAGKLNLVMIADTSGSNFQSYDSLGNLLPGTDPFGVARFQTLKLFVDSFNSYSAEDRENIYFSLITFSTTSKLVSGFTNDLGAFRNTVQNQLDTLNDVGGTDMPAALSEANRLISADIERNAAQPEPMKSNYVIIFVTDGRPTRGSTLIPIEEVLDHVEQINALGLNSEFVQDITLHTGFYCSSTCSLPEGQEGKENTRRMAEVGGGDALYFEEEGINYQKYALPVTKVKYQARDIRARNLSANWYQCKYELDSDQDGLVDEEEKKLGSNPQKRDSDGDGISDLVQKTLTGSVCTSYQSNGNCVYTGNPRYDSCTSYLTSSSGGVQYKLSGDRFMNKCELLQLEVDPELWDAGDWMPYAFRALSGLSFIRESGDLSLDPDKDDKNNYEEIVAGTDPYCVGHESDPEYEYSLSLVKSHDDLDEYHLEIKNITTIGEGNLFAVYLLEHAPTGDNKRYIKVAQDRFQGKRIEFTDEDFQ